MPRSRIFGAAVPLLVALGLASIASALRAQTPTTTRKTVWNGVYTNAQADRAAALVESSCSVCHGPTLGGDEGPGLHGAAFSQTWFEDTLASLYAKIKDTMPGDQPGTLTPRETADVLAYILRENQFPAGAEELKPDVALLADIHIEGKNGPGPIPEFSMVRVVGCLGKGPKDAWMLRRSTAPLRARDSKVDNKAKDTPLGDATFLLTSNSGALTESALDHKVEARGVLVHESDANRINVILLTTLGAACPQ